MDILLILALAIVILIVIIWWRRRLGSVAEGYAVPIQWMGRHSRVVRSGPYWLRPGERAGELILVRQREVFLSVPDIYIHSGLPVRVNLKYSMSLALGDMHRDELYYTEPERDHQQVRIFKDTLQRLIPEFPSAANPDGTARVDLGAVFSPFFGAPLFTICDRLQLRVQSVLESHGIRILPGTLMIDSLTLPQEIVRAYQDLFQSNFEGVARQRFIGQIRNAAPGMSESGLIQLYNAINNNTGEVRTIFANGAFVPNLYLTEQDTIIGASAGIQAPRSTPISSASTESRLPPRSQQNYPLTAEDMALLKALSK